MNALCDACNRPTAAHTPEESEACATFDAWACIGCGERLVDDPAMRQGALCLACAEIVVSVTHDCTFFDAHPPDYVRRMNQATGRFEWVAP